MTADNTWSELTSGDPYRMAAAASQVLPFWVSLVLVVLIAWTLAGLVWKLWPGGESGDAITVPIAAASGTRPSSGGGNVAAIAEAHLFGEADPDEVVAQIPEPGPIENLEETRKNLTLKGTIASDVEEQSAAIIAIGSDDEQVFMIGQTVMSGASLHSVFTDRVVLDENGILTALYLPKESDDNGSRPRPAPRRVPTQAVSRTATPSIQSVVASNVARLSDVIRPTPYFVDGQQQGYRVYPGRNRRQFQALGLRAGDLIQDIDGQALSDPAQAMEIFQSLGSADQVSVTVVRDGEPQSITLSVDQLELDGNNNE